MRAIYRCLRILILCLLCFTVFVPMFLVPYRLKHIISNASRDYGEDLSIIKHRAEVLTLRAIDKEGREGLRVPPVVVYKDGTDNSLISDNVDVGVKFGEAGVSEYVGDYEKSNATRPGKDNDNQTRGLEHERPLSGKEEESKTEVVVNDQVHSRSRRTVEKKVKEMKDQVLRAKAYLTFILSNGNSQFVRELKVRMRDVERAMNHCTTDSRISRSALQKMKAMESTLSKAHRMYPDCTAMIKRLHAMTHNAQEQVRSQSTQESYLRALNGRTIPKGHHCLSMTLTAEYFALEPKQRLLPYQQKIQDPHLYHFAIFSDNVLACSVVVNSTVSNARDPEKLVFHIVTDSLNFPAMSMWFLSNPPGRAAVHVESIENFGWLSEKYNVILQGEGSVDPRYASELNHLRFDLPDIFFFLDKLVFLDHDVVVQTDLTSLWSIDMSGKVNGAVQTCTEGEPSFQRMDKLVNFTDPIIANAFEAQACTWAFGMNVFYLKEWRQLNLTGVYHKFLHLGAERPLWKSGSLPIGWITFYGHTFALDKRWHLLGLGHDSSMRQEDIDRAAVVHFDGIQKPWLEIGIEKYKPLWNKHVNYDHPYLQHCNIHE